MNMKKSVHGSYGALYKMTWLAILSNGFSLSKQGLQAASAPGGSGSEILKDIMLTTSA